MLQYLPITLYCRCHCVTASKVGEMCWSKNPTLIMTINTNFYFIINALFAFAHKIFRKIAPTGLI